jgi:diamine N-acetyltransferase
VIANGKVTLTALTRRHLDATRAWANDPHLARLLDRAWPVSEMEHEEWFAGLRQHTDRVYFAIEEGQGTHIGNIWLWDIDARHRKAELRIVIGESTAAGRGLGSDCIDLMCRYAFDRLNLRRIVAFVLSTNPRARRAFEKAGFELEGTLKQDRWTGDVYSDVYLLGRLK